MRKFVFRFDALLRLKRNRRDLCRQLLGQAMAMQESLVQQRQTIEATRRTALDEIRDIGSGGGIDIDRMASRRYYAGQLGSEMQLIRRNEDLTQKHVEMCRQALVTADRDIRVLEKLEEQERAQFQSELERRLERELEDAWRGAIPTLEDNLCDTQRGSTAKSSIHVPTFREKALPAEES